MRTAGKRKPEELLTPGQTINRLACRVKLLEAENASLQAENEWRKGEMEVTAHLLVALRLMLQSQNLERQPATFLIVALSTMRDLIEHAFPNAPDPESRAEDLKAIHN